MSKKLNIAYIFTTFPVKSETFLQREIECLQDEPIRISLFSLWGGKRSFNGIEVRTFKKIELVLLPILLIWTAIKSPCSFFKGLKEVISTKPTSLLNLGENIVGLAFGLRYANQFKKVEFDHIHATWATMPATAAMIIYKLTGIPYSMGAHAYDLFKNNGDGFLTQKIEHSKFIHTSSYNAQRRLIKKGASSLKIALIRRGLTKIPAMKKSTLPRNPLKIISIGRLVEKKGFLRQLKIYKELKDQGFAYHAKIIGEGHLKSNIQHTIRELGLEQSVELLPWMPYNKLERVHTWADVFLFTGLVAKDGDRDGLPNVIPEIMAKGVAVVTSDVSAIPEVIKNRENGIIISDYDNTCAWCNALIKVAKDNEFYLKITTQARKWVEQHYDGKINAKKLLSCFKYNKSANRCTF